jgi:hypothetical protein
MSNQSNHELSTWEVNQIRFTAFPSPAEVIFEKPDEWWSALTGDKPENILHSPQVGRTVINGNIQEGNLILEVQPIRIDWVLTISDKQPGVLTIGSFPSILHVFKNYINKWFTFETYPNLHRLAFGVNLLQGVKSREEGYERIDKYLPYVEIDANNSSDFNYRINRPRPSRNIENLSINRLSTWSVIIQTMMTIGLPSSRMHNQPTSINCSLQLDINTFDDYSGEFSQENSPTVFAELTELGEEIAAMGDVK